MLQDLAFEGIGRLVIFVGIQVGKWSLVFLDLALAIAGRD